MTKTDKQSRKIRVLIVDDEPAASRAIANILLMRNVAEAITCNDSSQAIQMIRQEPVDLVIMDLVMPNKPGQELLDEVKAVWPNLPVIMVTGLNDVSLAVQCIKTGAFDYLVKPVEADHLCKAIQRAREHSELDAENRILSNRFCCSDLKQPEAFSAILTQNDDMYRLFVYLEAISSSPQALLITGETGVGKELIAHAAHRLCGGEKDAFVSVNVAGVDSHMFSDTLFGHRKGAFTGAEEPRSGLVESAAGGTLFLDEIGDLQPEMQVRLLRLLQEGEYLPLGADRPRKLKARLLFATNCDLSKRVEDGTFRRDLYYRLARHQVCVPPLRDRLDDLPVLVHHFVVCACEEMERPVPKIPRTLFALLRQYSFPGNIRELESLVYDALCQSPSETLEPPVFAQKLGLQEEETSAALSQDAHAPLQIGDPFPTLKDATVYLVDEAMKRTGHKQTEAARLLGISQQALSQRLKRR
jgi:DNA-binding NtrC family response regulator